MNELKRIENERKERERIISQDIQKFVQHQDQNHSITNNTIQRTASSSSSSRRSSMNQDYLQRLNSSSNRTTTTQRIVKEQQTKQNLYLLNLFSFLDNVRTTSWN